MMTYDIRTEGFELTDAIQNYTENLLRDIGETLPDKTTFMVFLKKESAHAFSGTFKAHLWHKSFVVKEAGPDLYGMISNATKKLARVMHKEKEKRKALIHKRAQKMQAEIFQRLNG